MGMIPTHCSRTAPGLSATAEASVWTLAKTQRGFTVSNSVTVVRGLPGSGRTPSQPPQKVVLVRVDYKLEQPRVEVNDL